MSRLAAWEALCAGPTPVQIGDTTVTLHRRRGQWSPLPAEADTLLAAPLGAPRRVGGALAWWDARRARMLAAAIAELGAPGAYPQLKTTDQRAIQIAWKHSRGEVTDHALAAAHAGAVAALQRAMATQRAIGRSLLMIDDPHATPVTLEQMAWGLARPVWRRAGLGQHATLPDAARAAHQSAAAALKQRADVSRTAVLDLVFAFWLGGRDRDGRPVAAFRYDQG